MRRFLTELKRRHVYQFGVIYLAVGWLLMQAAAMIEEALALPSWTDTLVLTLLAIGFPIVLLLAWAADSKPPVATTQASTDTVARDEPDRRIRHGTIRFCTTPSGYRLAYSRVGRGPPILRTGNWTSHQELEWDTSITLPFLRDFSRDLELITYDGRGTGLSDRNVDEFSLETMLEDMQTVADANDLEKFCIFAISQSCAVSIAYAARHPERVERMVLLGGFAHNFRPPEEVDAIATLFAQSWGQANAATRQMFTSALFPDATKEEFDEFNELQRQCLTAENATRLFRAVHAIDVREEAKRVRVPTLVLHSRDEPGVPLEYGREMATLIPGARFVTLNSRNHIILGREPAYREFLDESLSFLRGD